MRKLTKIIATIGPSCDSEEMIEKLILTGVNVFRFNFKHSTVEWHDERIELVNKVAKRLGVPIGTLIDLQGPELRILLNGETIEMDEGENIPLLPEVPGEGNKGMSITHPDVIGYLHTGQLVLADDGKFEFEVVREEEKVFLQSKQKATMKNRKTMNIPGAEFPFPVLIDRDFEGLRLAGRRQVDYVALSFVRDQSDIMHLREEMAKYHLKAQVISKVETQKAIDNLNEILEASDGIMVARGDLGVEMPIQQVPYYTRMIIDMCIALGKPVITATQMIESMLENPYPTRAEISDIANATYSLTDAVMLSGETASGKHPLGAVRMMQQTVIFNEQRVFEDTRQVVDFVIEDQTDLLCDAAYNMSLRLSAQGEDPGAFVVFTHTGKTARRLSMFKPRIPIYSLSPSHDVVESLTLHFGVYPVLYEMDYQTTEEVLYDQVKMGLDYLYEQKIIETGKKYIVLFGDFWAIQGGTSTLKIVNY